MDFRVFKDIISEKFPELSDDKIESFRKMEDIYKDWNSKINVISRKDIDMLYLHHVLHSLAIAAYLKSEKPSVFEQWSIGNSSILDLGTGGGFPGIPLAIMFPNSDFTLCDSVGKKTIVAAAVTEALGLKNVKVVNARAESLTTNFDYVVSRAVTSLDKFYPWVKGRFSKSILYLKGGDVAEETAQLMSRYRMTKGSISVWKISTWNKDNYFEGKYVINLPSCF